MAALVTSVVLAAVALAYANFAMDSAIKAETELRLIDDWLVQHGVEKRDGKYVFKEERIE